MINNLTPITTISQLMYINRKYENMRWMREEIDREYVTDQINPETKKTINRKLKKHYNIPDSSKKILKTIEYEKIYMGKIENEIHNIDIISNDPNYKRLMSMRHGIEVKIINNNLVKAKNINIIKLKNAERLYIEDINRLMELMVGEVGRTRSRVEKWGILFKKVMWKLSSMWNGR